MNYILLLRVYEGISLFLNIISGILLAYCLMSWFVPPTNRLFQIVSRFTQPLVAPFRPIAYKLMERGFRIDISVLLAFLAIRVIESLLLMLFRFLFTFAG